MLRALTFVLVPAGALQQKAVLVFTRPPTAPTEIVLARRKTKACTRATYKCTAAQWSEVYH